MNILKNKKIFIAPYTPMSNALKRFLSEKFEIDFLGFIDKNKSGKGIYKIDNINANYDYIVILSPNHFQDIYKDYIKIVDKRKLIVIEIENQKYNIKHDINLEQDRIKTLSLQHPRKQGIVFISKGFVDTNNKYLFLSCYRSKLDVTLITDNKDHLNKLKAHDLPVIEMNTKEADTKISLAKYIVFDQANYTNFFIHPAQTTIQQWHGVGLKKMSKLTNIVYDYFISTSKWTNKTNFKNVFLAKKYLDYGYPRNEFLLRETKEEDLLLCDKDLYELSLRHKIILYMPTIREYLFSKKDTLENILNISLKNLNEELRKLDYIMIVKLHPYVIEFYKDFIINCTYSNIFFHSAQGDVYPVLKNTDILVTDYSSVAYDFLLLNKKIIFFDYDRDVYEKNMGGFLFDYDKYSPGIKTKTQEEMINAIYAPDVYSKNRSQIKKLFFNEKTIHKSTDLIKNLFKKEYV